MLSTSLFQLLELKRLSSLVVVLKIFFLIRVFRARYYKGKLFGVEPKLPFPNLEAYVEAVEAGTAKLVDVDYQMGALHYINNSEHPLLRRLVKALDHNPIQIMNSIPEWMNRVDKYRSMYTYITSQMGYRYLRSQYCDLTFVTWPTGKRYLGLVFKKNSSLMHDFTSVMYTKGYSVNDFYEKVIEYYLPPKYCNFAKLTSVTNQKSKPFNMHEFGMPLLIWFVLMVGCCLVFCLECWNQY